MYFVAYITEWQAYLNGVDNYTCSGEAGVFPTWYGPAVGASQNNNINFLKQKNFYLPLIMVIYKHRIMNVAKLLIALS